MATPRPEVTGRRLAGRSSRKPVSQRLVYTVPEAGRLLGLGRNAAYDAAKRGDIPTLRIGRLLLVPKGLFHKLVGAEVLRPTVEPQAGAPLDGAQEHLEESER